jgi:TolA-binding protein
MGGWTPGVRRGLVVAGLVLAVGVFTAAGITSRGGDADSTYRNGQVVYDKGKLEEALPYFQKAQRLAPLSNTAIHSTYYESIILFRLERWAAAEESFTRLATRYPEANAAPESLYHVGLCRARLNDRPGAIHGWHEMLRRYPNATPWGGYARDRLREAGAPETPPAPGAPAAAEAPPA